MDKKINMVNDNDLNYNQAGSRSLELVFESEKR